MRTQRRVIPAGWCLARGCSVLADLAAHHPLPLGDIDRGDLPPIKISLLLGKLRLLLLDAAEKAPALRG